MFAEKFYFNAILHHRKDNGLIFFDKFSRPDRRYPKKKFLELALACSKETEYNKMARNQGVTRAGLLEFRSEASGCQGVPSLTETCGPGHQKAEQRTLEASSHTRNRADPRMIWASRDGPLDTKIANRSERPWALHGWIAPCWQRKRASSRAYPRDKKKKSRGLAVAGLSSRDEAPWNHGGWVSSSDLDCHAVAKENRDLARLPLVLYARRKQGADAQMAGLFTWWFPSWGKTENVWDSQADGTPSAHCRTDLDFSGSTRGKKACDLDFFMQSWTSTLACEQKRTMLGFFDFWMRIEMCDGREQKKMLERWQSNGLLHLFCGRERSRVCNLGLTTTRIATLINSRR